jgi:hypothetical protein
MKNVINNYVFALIAFPVMVFAVISFFQTWDINSFIIEFLVVGVFLKII